MCTTQQVTSITPHFIVVVVVLLLVFSVFFSVLSECVFLSEYSISLGNEVMCLEHGAGYECRSSCGVQQKGSYPLNPRVSAQRDGLLGAGEKLIMLLLSPPGPLLIFFLYKCWQSVMNFNIAPLPNPLFRFSQHSYTAVPNHTHFLAITNSFKLSLGDFFSFLF